MIGSRPAGAIVIEPLFEIMIEGLGRTAVVALNVRRPPFVALLETAYATEIAPDSAGEMRELDIQVGQLVQQPGIDDLDGGRHQRKLPAQHAAEVIRIHLIPADDLGQGMDEDVEPEIGRRLPERAQLFRIESQPLHLGCDDDAGEFEFDRATLQFRRHLVGL